MNVDVRNCGLRGVYFQRLVNIFVQFIVLVYGKLKKEGIILEREGKFFGYKGRFQKEFINN